MNSCKRCGTCCKNGGPALHKQDLHLFDDLLQIENCITIRKGEPAFNPLTQNIEPTECELIKIAGDLNSWQCSFYKENKKQCEIYSNRPVECDALQCWDTEALTQMIYIDTLSRSDLVNDESLLEMIIKHEKICSYFRFEECVKERNSSELSQIINLDLSIRQEAVKKFALSLPKELFCFGRPIFKSASFYDIKLRQTARGFEVTYDS